MKCQKCNSERIAIIDGKTSDLCCVSIGENEHDGYVPDDLGIGGGDYIDFEYCLNCGQIQGKFPLPKAELEAENETVDQSEITYLSPDEIFDNVLLQLTPEFIFELKQTPEDDLIAYHSSMGRWIRNQYNLWSIDNPYVDSQNSLADNFPDQISQKIIERIWEHVTGKKLKYKFEIVDKGDGQILVNKVER